MAEDKGSIEPKEVSCKTALELFRVGSRDHRYLTKKYGTVTQTVKKWSNTFSKEPISMQGLVEK